jgi:hypothetical protein
MSPRGLFSNQEKKFIFLGGSSELLEVRFRSSRRREFLSPLRIGAMDGLLHLP